MQQEYNKPFTFTVKTNNIGTTGDKNFVIVTSTSGITTPFLYDIETSDGQVITGVTGDYLLTFPEAGEYDISIKGSFPYMYFNNGKDSKKITNIKNFGIYAKGSTSQENAFSGCSNMVITATDSGYFGDVVNFDNTWRKCSSLLNFPLLDFRSSLSFESAWRDCFDLITFPSNAFDFCNSSNYRLAFFNTSLTTQSIDNVLVSIDSSGVINGVLDYEGNEAPSPIGFQSILNLTNKGWLINQIQ